MYVICCKVFVLEKISDLERIKEIVILVEMLENNEGKWKCLLYGLNVKVLFMLLFGKICKSIIVCFDYR